MHQSLPSPYSPDGGCCVGGIYFGITMYNFGCCKMVCLWRNIDVNWCHQCRWPRASSRQCVIDSGIATHHCPIAHRPTSNALLDSSYKFNGTSRFVCYYSSDCALLLRINSTTREASASLMTPSGLSWLTRSTEPAFLMNSVTRSTLCGHVTV